MTTTLPPDSAAPASSSGSAAPIPSAPSNAAPAFLTARRDLFAAHAMAALIGALQLDAQENSASLQRQIAREAYAFADAMLAARDGK